MSSSSGAGQREVAYRVFAAEYDDADLEHKESDEERAPNYVVTPTGARINRLFVVGVLTEVETVSEGVLRARVVDPTGAFVCYAGQYQPDEQAFLERADPPTFVAMTGKARTFSPEDSDRIFTSVRPEAINEVDAATRDRWTVQTAEQTVDRIRTMAGALALDQRGEALRDLLGANGVDAGLAAGIPLALAHYGTTRAYLASLAAVAIEASRLVAGDLEEIEATTVQPTATGEADLPVPAHEFDDPSASEPAAPGARTPAETATSESSTDGAAAGEPGDTGDQAADAATAADEGAGSADAPAVDAEAADRTDHTAPANGGTAERPTAAAEDSPPTGTGTPESAGTANEASDGPGAFEPGSFDLDEDERAEVEDEFGTEFQSGADVDEPGTADIETPGPDEGLDPDAAEPAADPETTAGDGADAAPAGDDLEDAAVDAMQALDDGDGAPRAAVIERVVDRTGAEESAVEAAVQAALMDGRCFEPADDRLQAI